MTLNPIKNRHLVVKNHDFNRLWLDKVSFNYSLLNVYQFLGNEANQLG